MHSPLAKGHRFAKRNGRALDTDNADNALTARHPTQQVCSRGELPELEIAQHMSSDLQDPPLRFGSERLIASWNRAPGRRGEPEILSGDSTKVCAPVVHPASRSSDLSFNIQKGHDQHGRAAHHPQICQKA